MTQPIPSEQGMTDAELHAHVLAGGSLTDPGVMGARQWRVGEPVPGPVPDPADMPMVVKSLRLPLGMVEAAEAIMHPKGLSGVIRDALEEWFERHGGREAEVADVEHALEVLAGFVHRRQAA